MSTQELLESEANRLMERTFHALPVWNMRPTTVDQCGVDPDIQDAMLREHGCIPENVEVQDDA